MFIHKNKATGRLIVNLFGLRLKFHLPIKTKHADEKFANLLYELADPRTLANVRLPKVLNLYDSLYSLINSNKSIARFGDGEFKIMMGESINFQKHDPKLAKRLEEVLQNNLENLYVGIPDVFGYCDSDYFRRVMVSCRDYLYKFMNFENIYLDAKITRQANFATKEQGEDYYANLKKIWQDKDLVIVEGAGSRLGIGNDLFANAKSIERIICPIKDAFSRYDEILEKCKTCDKEKLFILALGPTATVLTYDLAQSGYRAIDAGHIDTMYEWFLNDGKKCSIEGKIVFNEERKADKIPHCKDENYYKQIIAKFD